MAYPTLHGTGVGSDGYPITSFPCNYPTTLSAGDLLIAHVFVRSGATYNTPAGWTLQTSISGGTAKVYIFSKPADGTETGTQTFVMSGAGTGVYGGGIMFSFSGTSGVEGIATPVSSLNASSIPGPSITTLGTERLALAFLEVERNETMTVISGQTGGTWAKTNEYLTSSVLDLDTAQIASAGTISGGNSTVVTSGDAVTLGFALAPGSLTKVSDSLPLLGVG